MLIKKLNLSVTKKSLIYREGWGPTRPCPAYLHTKTICSDFLHDEAEDTRYHNTCGANHQT